MKQSLELQLYEITKSDDWMLSVLQNVRDLRLQDCWIGAGFVRNKIWDIKHCKNRTELNDIDVIYYNKQHSSKVKDANLELKLKNIHPNYNWSVKNQARMHLRNNHAPYANCEDAISFWPETATAIAIRLNDKDEIEYIAPYGLNDLFYLVVQPTPNFDLTMYKHRIEKKDWKKTWNKLTIL